MEHLFVERERRGLSSLCWIIALLACLQFAIPEPTIAAAPPKANGSNSIFEPIKIMNLSMDIERGTWVKDLQFILQWNARRKRITRSNDASLLGLRLSVKSRIGRISFNADRKRGSDFSGRYLTEVHYGHINPPISESPRRAVVHYLNLANHGIGPQLMLGGTLSTFYQFLGSTPQPTGKNGQYKGNGSEKTRDINKPPFSRRIVASLLMFFGGFWLYGLGWHYFYDQRRVLGTTLIYSGIFILLSGVGLWLITGFRWNWGWWI